MKDEPVEQEPSQQTVRSNYQSQVIPPSSLPLPFVYSNYEKKVDEDPETHSDDDSRHLQPGGGCNVTIIFPSVVAYM